jgi:hypothetical protein
MYRIQRLELFGPGPDAFHVLMKGTVYSTTGDPPRTDIFSVAIADSRDVTALKGAICEQFGDLTPNDYCP